MNPCTIENRLSAIARRVVDQRASPAAAVCVAWRDAGRWRTATGWSGNRSTQRAVPISPSSIFDLASLTKPVVAATIARHAARSGLSLRAKLGELHPALARTFASQASLELALAHRAGLHAHLELFIPWRIGRSFSPDGILRQAAASRPHLPSGPQDNGFEPLYSDLGYLLAGAAIEHHAERPLDSLIDKHISKPLNLELGSMRWWLQQPGFSMRRIVPTEIVSWRGGELTGEVHDENAWLLAGHRSAGHAGVFGSVAAVCGFATMVLDAVAGRAAHWLTRDQIEPLVRVREGGTLRAGFDGKSCENSAAGTRCSPETFGHLGFTGTSFWCDPVHEIATVLLTNRVNPTRNNGSLRALRPVVHDELFAFAHWKA